MRVCWSCRWLLAAAPAASSGGASWTRSPAPRWLRAALGQALPPRVGVLRAPSSPPRALLCCVLQELLPNSIAPHSMHLPLTCPVRWCRMGRQPEASGASSLRHARNGRGAAWPRGRSAPDDVRADRLVRRRRHRAGTGPRGSDSDPQNVLIPLQRTTKTISGLLGCNERVITSSR
jgi:hypothetical protein